MLIFFSLLLVSSLTAPDEPLAGQFRAAIWSDLHLNGMIGNSSITAYTWYHGAMEDPDNRRLHIQNLKCKNGKSSGKCTFKLFREGGVVKVREEEAPDEIHCKAKFISTRGKEPKWQVKHLPAKQNGGGHSRTTLQCKRTKT